MATPNLAGYQSYQKNKYETASPHKLILMLYDGAIRFSKQAIKAIEQNNVTEANSHIQKAQSIFYELISSLNVEQGGEVAQNLKNLYLYNIDQLMQANIKKDAAPIAEVIDITTDIKSAWMEIGKKKEQSIGT